VTAVLQQAGATVTGEVDIEQSFLNTSAANEVVLTQLAESLSTRAGLTPPAQSQSRVAGQQAVAQVLAASLLDTPAGTALSAKSSAAILGGLEQNGFVAASTTPQTATLAVLVAPGGAPPQTGSQVLVALAAQLNAASSATVMAGAAESVGAGSVISNENSANQVSTVDNADTESGQIMVVQALRYLLDGKAPAAFGIDSGNAPSPAPTPSATPTGTTSVGPGRHL
jgi:predicted aconitase with swiveling domain